MSGSGATREGSSALGPESRLLLDLTREVTSSLDLQDVLDKSFKALRELISFDGGAIQLIEDGDLVAAATDPPAKPEALTVRIPVGTGVSGAIAATGEPIYIPDIAVDERVHPEGRKKGLSGGVRSYFGAPLILHGAPIGVVQIDSLTVDAFGPRDRSLMLAFLPTIAAAVQNAMLFGHELETVERLREIEQLKRDFLAAVSHELRTPITTIVGFAAFLADTPPESTDEVREIAERIGKAGRHLGRLVEDILDVAEFTRGEFSVEPTTVDVAAVLDEVVAAQRKRADDIVVTVPRDLPPVSADPHRLLQVLQNLLANAVKFSPPGRPIDVRAWVDGDRVAVSVEDRGDGIPVELHGRVFERFFQADQSAARKAGGLGIGLFLVRRLMERMGGDVTLDSESGQGARFTVRLRPAP